MSKKLIALLLAAIMVFGVLAGCGSKTEEPAEKPAETETPAEPETEEEAEAPADAFIGYTMPLPEEKHVSFMIHDNGQAGDDMSTARIHTEFTRLTNIVFDFDPIEAVDYAQVANVRLSAGTDLADIVRIPNTDGDSKFQDSGLFIPLNDLIEKYGVNTKKLFEARPDIKAQLTNKDGNIFFLSSVDMPSNLYMMMFMNQEWLEQVGMEQPTTAEEFYEVLKAFKGVDFNGNGEADEIPMTATPWELSNWCCQYFGLDFVNGFTVEEDGTVQASIASPRLKDYVTWMNKLYSEDLLDKAYASKTWEQVTTNIVTNQIGAIPQWSFNLMSFNRDMLERDYENFDDCAWTALMPLSSDVSEAQLLQRPELGSFFGITAECEDPVTAFIAMDYMLGDEYQMILNWGAEGIDWEYDEAGEPVVLDITGVEGASGKGYPGHLLIQSPDPVYAQLSDWHIALDEELQTYAKPGFPRVYGTEDEINALLTYESDMLTFFSEQMNMFITGQRPIEEFDEYIQTLKDMGIDDVVAVKQAQYDRFTAAFGE